MQSSQHNSPTARLPTAQSKDTSKGKNSQTVPKLSVSGSQSEPAPRRQLRLRPDLHADTDEHAREPESDTQAGSSDVQPTQAQQRRSKRGLNARGCQAEATPKEAAQPPEPAHASKSTGKAVRVTAAAHAIKTEGLKPPPGTSPSKGKGKSTAGSKVQALSPAEQLKSAAKGKPKGTSAPVAVLAKHKPAIADAQQAKALPQAAVVKAKAEPVLSTPPVDSSLHEGQKSTGLVDAPLGLGLGKRKRTATKFLYMDDHTSADKQAGSKGLLDADGKETSAFR